jgi:hypothetical protein
VRKKVAKKLSRGSSFRRKDKVKSATENQDWLSRCYQIVKCSYVCKKQNRQKPYSQWGNNPDEIVEIKYSRGRIHRHKIRYVRSWISVMTTFSSWFSCSVDQIITMNKSALSLVQFPQIQP